MPVIGPDHMPKDNDLILFGKHIGRTHIWLVQNDHPYCVHVIAMAENEPQLGNEQKATARYVEANLIKDRRAHRAAQAEWDEENLQPEIIMMSSAEGASDISDLDA